MGGAFSAAPSEAGSSCGAHRLPRPGAAGAAELLEEVLGTGAAWCPPQGPGQLYLATYAAASWFSVLGNMEELQILFHRSKLRARSGNKNLGRK